MAQYRTEPEETTGMPSGVPYIIANEAAERFSYYGMRSILVIYMSQWLVNSAGALDTMTKDEAKGNFALFGASVYFCSIFGALISDGFLGKYRTILYVSLIYCLGHLVLSLGGTAFGNSIGFYPRVALAVGLGLIALGSGGIKPCVSANVGDQFGSKNLHLLENVYGWFYFSINAGSVLSTILIPRLLGEVVKVDGETVMTSAGPEGTSYGPHVAFAVPGVLMLIATLFFWMGRNRFVHRPPGGLGFIREAASPEGRRILTIPVLVALFVAVFWSLYEQCGSAWVLQAEEMDRHFSLSIGSRSLFNFDMNASETHTLNPILILIFIPLFGYVIYPAINHVFRLTAIRKISIGLFLTALAFSTSAIIESYITKENHPHVLWQVIPYVIMTAAEVMVSITGLEFSYSIAPKSMKSVVMSIWLLSNATGQLLTWAVNKVIQNPDKTSKLPGASYYWVFTAAMLLAAIGFVIVSMTFRKAADAVEPPTE